jgi:DNA-binding MarR family transcriptional regulator
MQGYADLFAPPRYRTDTAVLRETHAWIEAFIAEHNYPPTVSEVAGGLHLTKSGAYGRLRKMQARGWISRDRGKRSIALRGAK